ncbi:MAG: hypothetical protein ABIQ40_07995 [Bacteroidia bacterium]
MRFLPAIVFSLLVLLSSFIEKKSTYKDPKARVIGLYDRDSLLNEFPAYRPALEPIAAYKRKADSLHLTFYVALAEMRSTYYRDSASYSNVVKQAKLAEISAMRMHIAMHAESITNEIFYRTQELSQPFNARIDTAEHVVMKNKKLFTIADKNQLAGWTSLYPKAKIINVTAEMRTEIASQK